jgi:hypothetical protein
MEPHGEKQQAWSLPYLTGKTYDVWWGSGLDFTHLSILTTPLFNPQDDGIIFKFRYTQNRELFDIGPMRGGAYKLSASDYLTFSEAPLDPVTCENGQYYHDNS